MEPRAHHVLIGLFTLLVAAAAILSALWLSKSYRETDMRDYVVVFNEAVRGLSNSSPVQYSGIRIGDVVRLSLDPDNPNRVRARIRILASVPVREDTQARLILVNIAGTSVIELSGGTDGSPHLEGKGGDLPVIVATPSPISQLLANSGTLLTHISELVVSARTVFSPENVQKLSHILSSLEQVSGALAMQGDRAGELVDTVTAAAEEATAALKRASQLMASADAVVSRQGRDALASAQRAAAAIEQTSASINRILAQNQGSLGVGVQGLAQLGPALQELRETLASIRVVAGHLQDNPASYLLGRERIQEFQP